MPSMLWVSLAVGAYVLAVAVTAVSLVWIAQVSQSGSENIDG
jgi:hypothetical protein